MIRKIVVLILILALTACGDSAVRKKVENLDTVIDEYAYALRWMRKNDAVAYHKKQDGTRPHIDSSAMDVIRVTGFTIKEKTLNADMTGATVVGELVYYHNEYGTLKTITYTQSWWYDAEAKKWYNESDFPQFK
jgi:uncharacterized lipoprotein YehR (DUF1307 family)